MRNALWRRILASLAVVGGAVAATLGGLGPATGAGIVTLTGAGATFPFPLYSRWFAEYNRLHPDVRVNYQAIGSGGGIEQVRKGTVDFGASDAPLSDAQLQEMGRPILLMPTVAGAIAMSYNIPGVGTGLRLTPQNIAALYLGQITRWSDPKLAADNLSTKLPDMPVTVVHRSDGSGTTFHFTSFLSLVSPAWATKVGRGTSVEWPVGIGGKGNEGVAGAVRQMPGAIGYVELAYVKQNSLTYALVKNRDGRWVAPSLGATTDAAAAGAAQMVKTRDVRVSIAHAPGPKTYPIVGFTYLLLPRERTDEAKGRALVGFLWWAIHDGEQDAAQLLYARLPEPIVRIDEGIIRQITYQGKALLTGK